MDVQLTSFGGSANWGQDVQVVFVNGVQGPHVVEDTAVIWGDAAGSEAHGHDSDEESSDSSGDLEMFVDPTGDSSALVDWQARRRTTAEANLYYTELRRLRRKVLRARWQVEHHHRRFVEAKRASSSRQREAHWRFGDDWKERVDDASWGRPRASDGDFWTVARVALAGELYGECLVLGRVSRRAAMSTNDARNLESRALASLRNWLSDRFGFGSDAKLRMHVRMMELAKSSWWTDGGLDAWCARSQYMELERCYRVLWGTEPTSSQPSL